jgi:hypothetical protein
MVRAMMEGRGFFFQEHPHGRFGVIPRPRFLGAP